MKCSPDQPLQGRYLAMELAAHGGHLSIGPIAVQETQKLANHQELLNHQQRYFKCWENLLVAQTGDKTSQLLITWNILLPKKVELSGSSPLLVASKSASLQAMGPLLPVRMLPDKLGIASGGSSPVVLEILMLADTGLSKDSPLLAASNFMASEV